MDKIIFQLHKAFDFINTKHYDNKLTSPIITVQKDTKKKGILGWCSCLPIYINTNRKDIEETFHEINLTTQCLDTDNYKDILATLYHEIVHLYNTQNNITDCTSRQNHLETFKTEAERIGLIVEKVPRRGWSSTHLSETLIDEIDEMELDINVFNIKPIPKFKEDKPKKPRKKMYKYICPNCGAEIKSDNEELEVICEKCEEHFIIAKK